MSLAAPEDARSRLARAEELRHAAQASREDAEERAAALEAALRSERQKLVAELDALREAIDAARDGRCARDALRRAGSRRQEGGVDASAAALVALAAATFPTRACAAAAELLRQDFVVVDGFWPLHECAAIRSALSELFSQGRFREGETYGGQRDTTGRGDLIFAVTEDVAPPEPVGHFRDAADAFVADVAAELHRLGSPDGVARGGGQWRASCRSALQCTLYPGGGARYVRHVDDPDGRYHRRLTLLLYLNEGWEEADGGCVEIYHPGQESVAAPGDEVEINGTGTELDTMRGRLCPDAGGGAAVLLPGLGLRSVSASNLLLCGDRPRAALPPVAGRLLLFWSDRRCPHAVAPSAAQRWAITCWYHDD